VSDWDFVRTAVEAVVQARSRRASTHEVLRGRAARKDFHISPSSSDSRFSLPQLQNQLPPSSADGETERVGGIEAPVFEHRALG
jgi:hypothetical protein